MATLTKHTLSYSNSGRGVPLTGEMKSESLPIHASATGALATDFDEVWMYANNNTSSSVEVNLIWGLSAVGDLDKDKAGNADQLVYSIQPQTRTLLANGRLLQNGLSVYAWVGTGAGEALVIDGYVNRIVA